MYRVNILVQLGQGQNNYIFLHMAISQSLCLASANVPIQITGGLFSGAVNPNTETKSGVKHLSAAVSNLVNERVFFGYPLSALGGWLVRYTLQPRVQLPLELVCSDSADVYNVPWNEIEQSFFISSF